MNWTSLRACGLAFALLVGGTAGGSAQSLPAVPPARAAELRAKADAATASYAAIIEEHATVYAVDPALVVSIIMVESKGDPNAYSSSGAMGLMQLMTATCEDYGIADPYDPNENIRGGVALLANHLNRYRGDLKRVLAAYNAGARRADDGSWKRIRETTKYVPAVLAYYAALRPGGDGYAPSDRPATPGRRAA
jgi:soluble lytic murein transglycosylase-like protein